jgi:hypothetical protein
LLFCSWRIARTLNIASPSKEELNEKDYLCAYGRGADFGGCVGFTSRSRRAASGGRCRQSQQPDSSVVASLASSLLVASWLPALLVIQFCRVGLAQQPGMAAVRILVMRTSDAKPA